MARLEAEAPLELFPGPLRAARKGVQPAETEAEVRTFVLPISMLA